VRESLFARRDRTRMTTDVLVVGIGGQGVMTAAETIARAALAAGLEATKTELAGMSQRGGIVCSQVRIGKHIEATEVPAGQVTLLLAFESAEGLRWSHYLAPRGRAFVDSWRAVPPHPRSCAPKYCAGSGRALHSPIPTAAHSTPDGTWQPSLRQPVRCGSCPAT
jgi:Pyruvate/2-oxoacid:ferredoxin oxidoreductase gamma subunit